MSNSPPYPPEHEPPAPDDAEWLDTMAHLMVALLPRGLPPERYRPMVRRWLDGIESMFREANVSPPPWVRRARELYPSEAAGEAPHPPR